MNKQKEIDKFRDGLTKLIVANRESLSPAIVIDMLLSVVTSISFHTAPNEMTAISLILECISANILHMQELEKENVE